MVKAVDYKERANSDYTLDKELIKRMKVRF